MKAKNEEQNLCKSSMVFSVRDKLDSDKDYYGKIYGTKNRNLLILVSFVLIFILLLLVIFISPLNFIHDNLRYFLSSSAQTLGAILGIVLTVTLFFVQTNVKDYGDKIFDYLFRSKIIVSYIIVSIVAIIMSLFSLLLIERTILFELVYQNWVLAFNVSNLISINVVLLLFSFLFLPFFIYFLYNLLKGSSYNSWLYNNIITNINNKNPEEVEIYLSALINFSIQGISNRNRIVLKEGVESLHDLMKFGIRNENKISDLMISLNTKNGAFTNRSDWFYTEILSSSYSLFQIMNKTKQYNSIRFLIKSMISYSIECLKYNQGNISSLILKEYQRMLISSIDDKNVINIINDEFKVFLRHSVCMQKRDFSFMLSDLFNEEFTILLLKENPHIINDMFSTYFHEIKNRNFNTNIRPINIEVVPLLIQSAYFIIDIYNKINGLKEFSKKEIFFLDKLKISLSDKSYLLGLYLFYNKKIKEATECKKYFQKLLNEKKYISKIKTEFSEKNDYTPRFNYLTHFMFTKVTDNGNMTYLSKKEILKVANEYDNQ